MFAESHGISPVAVHEHAAVGRHHAREVQQRQRGSVPVVFLGMAREQTDQFTVHGAHGDGQFRRTVGLQRSEFSL